MLAAMSFTHFFAARQYPDVGVPDAHGHSSRGNGSSGKQIVGIGEMNLNLLTACGTGIDHGETLQSLVLCTCSPRGAASSTLSMQAEDC